MEFCISAAVEYDLKKKVDDLRYRYDRPLVREKYPYVNIFGPIEHYANLKKIVSDFTTFIKGRKRFRITTDIIGYLEVDQTIFLNVNDKGEMRECYDYLCSSLDLYESPFFFPHIIIAKNHSQEELSQIYKELQGVAFQYSYFPESFGIYVKTDKYWEEYSTLSI